MNDELIGVISSEGELKGVIKDNDFNVIVQILESGAKGEQGNDGYTPQKGIDYFDGKDGVDGVDGQDGYTPQKGIDYFDGEKGDKGDQGIQGLKGNDGYTPVKGLDYFDGQDGSDAEVTNENVINAIGYTPFNKAGGVLDGAVTFKDSANYNYTATWWNCNPAFDSPYSYGMYQWDNKFQFTKRDTNNVFINEAWWIELDNEKIVFNYPAIFGSASFWSIPTVNGINVALANDSLPASQVIEETNKKFMTDTNKTVLDKFTEVEGELLYNGTEIGGAVPNLSLNELILGGRYKIFYNDIEDSLDIEVI